MTKSCQNKKLISGTSSQSARCFVYREPSNWLDWFFSLSWLNEVIVLEACWHTHNERGREEKKKDAFGKEKIPGTFKWLVIRLRGLKIEESRLLGMNLIA